MTTASSSVDKLPDIPAALALSADDRLLIVAPHPDDETLAAGGLIQYASEQGACIHVVFFTDGDNNPWVQRVAEKRVTLSPHDRARFAARRRREARRALSILSPRRVATTSLHYPDQGLTAHLMGNPAPLVASLVELLIKHQPTVLVSPADMDTHPDHNALAIALDLALARTGSLRPRRLTYLVHGKRTLPAELPGISLPMSPEQHHRKWRAACAHATQLSCHRRMFARIARDPETFLTDVDNASILAAAHPLRDIVVGHNTVWLDLRPKARIDARGQASLQLLVEKDDDAISTLEVHLRWRKDSAAILTPAGEELPFRANLRPRRRGGFVQIPLHALHDARRLFVKLHRPKGFFDEAGWAPVPLPSQLISRSREPGQLAAIGSTVLRPRICAVVPCYNVAALCSPVIREVARLVDHVLAVDDGSTDGTGRILQSLAATQPKRITVLSIKPNGGKGAALIHAFKHALKNVPFDFLITIDGDGQHRPDDIPALAAACLDGAEFVLGQRTGYRAMPLRSRLGNSLTRRLLTRLFPGCPQDTQSGLRAFHRDFIQSTASILRPGRYETELQMLLLAIRQHRRITTVPIPTLYFDQNRSSHFRPLVDSVKIYVSLLRDLRSPRGEAVDDTPAPVVSMITRHD